MDNEWPTPFAVPGWSPGFSQSFVPEKRLNEIDPPGLLFVPDDVSVTVAVQVVTWSTAREEGTQETLVAVDRLEKDILDLQRQTLANYRRMQVDLRTIVDKDRFQTLRQRLERILGPAGADKAPADTKGPGRGGSGLESRL